jgi:hypothetical protein
VLQGRRRPPPNQRTDKERTNGCGPARRPRTMNRILVGAADKTNLLLEFLENDYSNGVTIIDPTGDLARKAGNRIPASFVRHAVYFDAANTRNIVGINVLESLDKTKHQALVELLCSFFDAMFPEGANTLARLNATHVFANGLRLLLEQKDETLLGILKLLSNKDFRKRCIDQSTDPVVRNNWEQINANPKQYESAIAFLQTKVGMLLMSPTIRNVVAQNMLLTSNDTILIANLNRAKLGDTTARLLGGLLMVHSTGPLYVHNFGFFAGRSDGLSSLFAQERLTLTLNYLDEVTQSVRQEVLNPSTEKYVFRTNRKDAEELAFYLGVPNPQILVDLNPNQVRSRTTGSEGYFPELPPTRKRLRAVKARTRARCSRPIEKINARVARYFATTG